MVGVVSNAGGGEQYEIPLFKILAALPKKLDESKDVAPLGLDEHLRSNGLYGTPVGSTKAIIMGGMNPYVMLGITAIMQEIYDAMDAKDKQPLSFMSVLAIQYFDKKEVLRQYQSHFDKDSFKDPTIAKGLQDFLVKNASRIQRAGHWFMAASPESSVTIPVQAFKLAIEAVGKSVIDKDRYEFGEHETSQGYIPGAAMDYDSKNPADRVLDALASVYGGKLLYSERSAGLPRIIIPENLWKAMVRDSGRSREF